jgi:hypothetical protein
MWNGIVVERKVMTRNAEQIIPELTQLAEQLFVPPFPLDQLTLVYALVTSLLSIYLYRR